MSTYTKEVIKSFFRFAPIAFFCGFCMGLVNRYLQNKQQIQGQGLVEYALILVLVAVVVIVILALVGPVIGQVFSNVVESI